MGFHILIVEDDPKLREVLCDYFLSKGDLPFEAANGAQALELAREQEFDAILLDIMMPGLDGFSVCRALRKDNCVPIIFLTALSDEDDKLLGYELGADDYVTKPFTMSVLYAKTAALIKRCRGSVLSSYDRIEAAGITLELSSHKVLIGKKEVVLTPNASRYGLNSTVLFAPRYYHDYTTGWEYSEEAPSPPQRFYMVTAVEFSPLRIAFHELRNVYIATFLLAVLCVLVLRRLIRRKLIEPVELVNDSISAGWTHISSFVESSPSWREPYELYGHYKETQDQLRLNKNEITRLNTALDYAKTAEQNRRQMTSGVAHELKTPLAVIHSYAEGLKEHIAEGKREKYLDVILSESEHLDGMVLELLDLSRLEAGKVKLAVDQFDLSALVYSVFERLEMAARAKDLHIEYDFPDNCTVTADEARIRQVVENFATNAVKYTPANGSIRLKITVGRYRTSPRTSTTFSIENDSAPLSDEALSRVWDTFYRADEARSGGGTGLGLAIAKNIVELHGGVCSVHNTKTGVLFQFTI